MTKPFDFEGLPEALYREISAATSWVPEYKDAPTRWQPILPGLALLGEAEKRYEANSWLTHKRLGLLDSGMSVLADHPDVVGPDRANELLLEFAIEALARVPLRVPKNTPFGAMCMSVWTRGHRALAARAPGRTPEWDAALARFEKAVKSLQNAPRTHVEGHLKSAGPASSLFDVGRTMPWWPLVGGGQGHDAGATGGEGSPASPSRKVKSERPKASAKKTAAATKKPAKKSSK